VAGDGGADFCDFASGVMTCWQSAQSDEWTGAQSFPVVVSTCEVARALVASLSRRASATDTTDGSTSWSNAVTRHSKRVRPVDRRM
jgi:hypothetical protein